MNLISSHFPDSDRWRLEHCHVWWYTSIWRCKVSRHPRMSLLCGFVHLWQLYPFFMPYMVKILYCFSITQVYSVPEINLAYKCLSSICTLMYWLGCVHLSEIIKQHNWVHLWLNRTHQMNEICNYLSEIYVYLSKNYL